MLLSGMFPEQNGIKRNCAAGRNEELGHDIECITDVLSDNNNLEVNNMSKKIRHYFLIALCSIILLRAPSISAKQPNFVFIYADDLGWSDIGCHGSMWYETPNIDKLAADGMLFTHAYSCASVCVPSRGAMLSGQYSPRTEIYAKTPNPKGEAQHRSLDTTPYLSKNSKTIPVASKLWSEYLQAAGYRTAIYGKWHNGDSEVYKRGFDEGYILTNPRPSDQSYFGPISTSPKNSAPSGVFQTDWLADEAMKFIERNKDDRFFCYLPTYAVHGTSAGTMGGRFEAPEKFIEPYKNKPPVGTDKDPIYAGLLANLDYNIGRVIDHLKNLNLYDNTIIIFASDNGGVGNCSLEGVGGGNGYTDNWPLREGKYTFANGGIRVPLIIRYPGITTQGTISHEPVIQIDLFPTILEAANIQKNANHILDGLSLMPLLKSDGSAQLAPRGIFFHYPLYYMNGPGWYETPASYMRYGDYYIMEDFEYETVRLYNVVCDMGEQMDIATVMPALKNDLYARLKKWQKELNAPIPLFKAGMKPPPRPVPIRSYADNAFKYVKYSGSWNLVKGNSFFDFYNNSFHVSEQAGASAEFSFEGISVHYITTVSPDAGMVDVYLDGTLVKKDLDLYSSKETRLQTVFKSGNLAKKDHTIRLEVTGNKNASSNGHSVGLDLFEYSGQPYGEIGFIDPATGISNQGSMDVAANSGSDFQVKYLPNRSVKISTSLSTPVSIDIRRPNGALVDRINNCKTGVYSWNPETGAGVYFVTCRSGALSKTKIVCILR
jgi:arylsulfatase A-like enzyme